MEKSWAGSKAGWNSAPERLALAAFWAILVLAAMQATMNLKIKFRESFRPFAPAVLQEQASKWFDFEPGHESPYMLVVAPVQDYRRVPVERRGDENDAT